MTFYRRVGEVPPKRHTQFRRPDGGLYAEELMGQEGFSSSSSLLYHRHPPTQVLRAEATEGEFPATVPNHPLLPRLVQTDAAKTGPDAVEGRRALLVNDDVTIGVAHPTEPSTLYRNADGDEVVFVRSGSGRLESSFGAIGVHAGDYVVVPQSTVHRWVPDEPMALLTVESRGHVGPPSHYLTSTGQFVEHAPYCERDLHGPSEPLLVEDRPAEILVRRGGRCTRYHLAHHPFDVVGWDGCNYPYRLSIHDFEPITGRIHQPPPVHQTFAGPGVVICSFVPRLLDYHPDAVPAPYNHANTDSDEVLYYVDGDFISRKGADIGPGSLTLHPSGFVHGPQPGSVEASIGARETRETAVMIDTFRPLELSADSLEVEDSTYLASWLPPDQPATRG